MLIFNSSLQHPELTCTIAVRTPAMIFLLTKMHIYFDLFRVIYEIFTKMKKLFLREGH